MNQSTLLKISMNISSRLRNICLILSLTLSSLSWAGEGHGDVKANASATSTPRFAAVSDALELVGVLNGKQITLFLDRLETNEPVKEALIELEF